MDPLEKAILEGGIAQDDGFGPERRFAGEPDDDSSPNTDDELASVMSDSDATALDAPVDKDLAALEQAEANSVNVTNSGKRGAPSTHTGPKGVINDKKVQDKIDRQKRHADVDAVNERLERTAISVNTWDEEERLRKLEDKAKAGYALPKKPTVEASVEELAARERRREQRLAEIKANVKGGHKVTRGPSTWFGHLREVDARGYADAIDNTDEGTFVVVHIYSKIVVKCRVLSSALTSLARQYPQVKFLQVRASAIGFGSASGKTALDDDDDGQTESDKRLREIELEEEAADVLPTVLIYRGGQLVHNLVRLDMSEEWGRGEERDVRDLLESKGILKEDNEERIHLDSDVESED